MATRPSLIGRPWGSQQRVREPVGGGRVERGRADAHVGDVLSRGDIEGEEIHVVRRGQEAARGPGGAVGARGEHDRRGRHVVGLVGVRVLQDVDPQGVLVAHVEGRRGPLPRVIHQQDQAGTRLGEGEDDLHRPRRALPRVVDRAHQTLRPVVAQHVEAEAHRGARGAVAAGDLHQRPRIRVRGHPEAVPVAILRRPQPGLHDRPLRPAHAGHQLARPSRQRLLERVAGVGDAHAAVRLGIGHLGAAGEPEGQEPGGGDERA